MAEIGYGVSYRLLDAQHFGVPQRRRRVFVVGYLGDWKLPAAVLFEPESLPGYPAPGGAAGPGSPGIPAAGTGNGGRRRGLRTDDHALAFGKNNQAGPIDTAGCLLGHSWRGDFESETFVVAPQYGQYKGGEYPILRAWGGDCGGGSEAITVAFSCKDDGGDASEGIAPTLRAMAAREGQSNAGGQLAVAIHENQRNELRISLAAGALSSSGGGKPGQGYPTVCITDRVTHCLPAEGADASEDGTGRGIPLVPAVAPCLTSSYGRQLDNTGFRAGPMLVPVAFNMHKSGHAGSTLGLSKGRADCLRAAQKSPFAVQIPGASVRRLTPRECERLQGFPDDYTLAPYRGRMATDGPRYKALGNSMAVPVMAWIGARIEAVDQVKRATIH